ncbi:MAG: DNA polymerase I, partial [bacterium]
NVPVLEHLEHFGVREPEPTVLLDFLRKMELRTLTGRVEAGLRRDGYVADKADHGDAAPAGITIAAAVFAPNAEGAPASQAVIPPSVHSPIDTKAYETITSLARLDDWVARIQAQGYVAFDTETASLNSVSGTLVGLSLAVEPGIACYIPVGHRGAGDVGVTGDLFGGGQDTVAKLPGQLELADGLAGLKPVLEDNAILKIGKNLKYDVSVMAQHDIAISPIDDTMLMSFALDAGRNSHGMDDLSLRLLAHQPIAFKDVCGTGKSQISFDQVALDRATAYAAEDADVTLRLWHILKPRLVQERSTTV